MTNKQLALQLTLSVIDTARKEDVYNTYSYFLKKLNEDFYDYWWLSNWNTNDLK